MRRVDLRGYAPAQACGAPPGEEARLRFQQGGDGADDRIMAAVWYTAGVTPPDRTTCMPVGTEDRTPAGEGGYAGPSSATVDPRAPRMRATTSPTTLFGVDAPAVRPTLTTPAGSQSAVSVS